jgi:hypothetical protein
MVSPDSGLLAPVDREYLRGEKDYDKRQSVHQREKAIRERVRNGIRDFELIRRNLSGEELNEIFEPYPDDGLQDGVQSALAVLFLGVTDEIEENLSNNPYSKQFNYDLTEGLFIALARNNWFLDDCRLTLDAEYIKHAEQARELANDGEDFNPGFIQYLLATDVIDEEPIQEEVRNQILEKTGGPDSNGSG